MKSTSQGAESPSFPQTRLRIPRWDRPVPFLSPVLGTPPEGGRGSWTEGSSTSPRPRTRSRTGYGIHPPSVLEPLPGFGGPDGTLNPDLSPENPKSPDLFGRDRTDPLVPQVGRPLQGRLVVRRPSQRPLLPGPHGHETRLEEDVRVGGSRPGGRPAALGGALVPVGLVRAPTRLVVGGEADGGAPSETPRVERPPDDVGGPSLKKVPTLAHGLGLGLDDPPVPGSDRSARRHVVVTHAQEGSVEGRGRSGAPRLLLLPGGGPVGRGGGRGGQR